MPIVIRVILPFHLPAQAQMGSEVTIEVEGGHSALGAGRLLVRKARAAIHAALACVVPFSRVAH